MRHDTSLSQLSLIIDLETRAGDQSDSERGAFTYGLVKFNPWKPFSIEKVAPPTRPTYIKSSSAEYLCQIIYRFKYFKSDSLSHIGNDPK